MIDFTDITVILYILTERNAGEIMLKKRTKEAKELGNEAENQRYSLEENTSLQNENQIVDENEYYDGEYDEEYEREYQEYREYVRYKRRQITRILLKVVAVVVAVLVVVEGVIGIVLSGYITKGGKLAQSEKAEDIIIAPLTDEAHEQWITAKGEEISLENDDGSTLHALKLKNHATSHSYMIMCHPMTLTPADMASFAYHFFDLGFTVILPYMRGSENSGYNKNSMGLYDSKDILKWIDMIVEADNEAKIFLHGVGLGGSAVLMASDENLPENVKAIIADSSYSDVKELCRENMKELFGLPSFPAVEFGSLFVQATEGWSFKDVDVLGNAQNAKVPVLIIHGGDDKVVPVSQSNDLYEVLPVKGSDHVLISGAAHAQCLNKNPDKYWRNVDGFILNNIGS